jgi:hypothetical protein
MKLKTLIALAVAGAFAVPLAAQASVDGDRIILAQAGGPAGASSTGTGPTGGVPSPRTAGEPKAPAGERGASAGASTAHCDTMTGSAREKCLSEAAAAGASSSAGGSVGSGTSTTTGTTAGPGSASNRTGSGSDTATTPGTSGHGKPK